MARGAEHNGLNRKDNWNSVTTNRLRRVPDTVALGEVLPHPPRTELQHRRVPLRFKDRDQGF
jgi:hypothetical protein